MTAPPRTYPGERLGLPRSGSGSVADTGPRIVAFLVDCLASGLVAAAVIAIFASHERSDFASRLPGNWSLVPFAVDYVVGLLVAGRTVGMYLTGHPGHPRRPQRGSQTARARSCARCC